MRNGINGLSGLVNSVQKRAGKKEEVYVFINRHKNIMKNVDWVIKHGSRTLLKQGCKEALTLFGVASVENLSVQDFEIITPVVKVGDSLEFQFQINNHNSISTKIRVEYLIFYKKANGELSRKIYKISEKEYSKNSKTLINRKQSFKKITTRKFYAGKHTISIVINGAEMCDGHFHVKLV